MGKIVVVPKEILSDEARVGLTPSLINKLTKLGLEVKIQSGAGVGIFASDKDFTDKGATVLSDAKALFEGSDVVIKVRPPSEDEVLQMRDGSVLISTLYPYLNINTVKALLKKRITSFGMELIPRITRAQDMDVLSSQATVAGYKAVLIAANATRFFFPMLSTAAGSIRPAKVMIIGAGVAGLQAIATARRLGAIVEAYDVRAETKEQVESLGAKFIDTKIEAAGTGGYARELTAEEKSKQQEVLKKHISGSDVVISTAGVPGKKAPVIITKEMVDGMKPGAVIVDLMAENGGNCELSQAGVDVVYNQKTILGPINISSSLSIHSSEMYAKNCINLLSLMAKDGNITLDFSDEIIKGTVVTHEGQVVHEGSKKLLEGKL